MKIISIVKIDGWNGNVIPGNPVDGDLVRMTYDNGTIREKIYWDITITPQPVPDQEPELRRWIRYQIDENTPKVIANFEYNSTTYNLNEEVIEQLKDFVTLLQMADDPLIYFPVSIVLSKDDGVETVASVNAAGFKNAYIAVQEHIKAKREEARALKTELLTMTLEQLQNWTDPRL